MTKLSLLFGLLMTVNNLNSPGVTVQAPATPSAVVMTQEEVRFVDLVNRERVQRGLQPLTVDPLLNKVARAHSREMYDKSYFSHTSPTRGLRTPMERYLSALRLRPSWALVGENLFYCSRVDVKRGHTALMNSEGHRANILEDRYERVGVGIYTDASGQFWVTQMFLSKTD